jgi:cbb3-type cytochrome oxidase maturation protein
MPVTKIIVGGWQSQYIYVTIKRIPIMSVIIVLLIASLSIALLFLGAFIWSARKGQFEDDYSPPLRMLFDDPPVAEVIPEANPTNQ